MILFFFFFGLILNLDIVIGMVIVDKIEGVCLIDFFFLCLRFGSNFVILMVFIN